MATCSTRFMQEYSVTRTFSNEIQDNFSPTWQAACQSCLSNVSFLYQQFLFPYDEIEHFLINPTPQLLVS